jgi:DNA-binding NtrC family response regulator
MACASIGAKRQPWQASPAMPTDTGDSGGTKLLRGGASEYVVRRFRIEVTAGPDAGKRAEAVGTELTVGTAAGNDLQLTDPTVSRQHLSISGSPEGFLLRDLGSSNGTLVAGMRVERAWIKTAAVITLGLTVIRFDVSADAIREPLSIEERYGTLLGKSAVMRRIFALVPRIAQADTTILLEGETGTGKSLLAEAIHQASPRKARPFVVVDCGAIAPTLIESELFGHERGAFTGAIGARVGAFEAAAGGTILLDEIGELPLDLQPKLLRALEAKEIKRVGSTEPIKLDVRMIAATHRDLREAVNRGSFRADLFYRTAVVSVKVPALRERPEDIPLLVSHFQGQLARAGEPLLSEAAVGELSRRAWPGNVRELRGAVERALLLGEPAAPDPSPESAKVPSSGVELAPFRVAKERAVAAWESKYLSDLVTRSAGNLSRAARDARMDRNHLRELLRRHGIVAQSE